jgi:hypothetical protein
MLLVTFAFNLALILSLESFCLFSCYKYLEFPCFIYEKCIICLGVVSAVGENHVKIITSE